MERFKFIYFAVVAIAILASLTACNKEKPEVGGFFVSGNTQIFVYADQTEAGSITFSFANPAITCEWTSIIEPAGSSAWISIDPESGSAANEYTVNIKLETNTTGLDRLALITIPLPCLWDTAKIQILVLQMATTEDGQLYGVTNPDNDDDVPMIHCPCEWPDYKYDSSGIQLLKGVEAYLFRDSLPRQMGYDFYHNESDFICWIIMNGAFGNDWIYFYWRGYNFRIQGEGMICNIPNSAKELDVAETGCKVYIEGLMYMPCRVTLGDKITFDFVLSKFKRLDN